MSLARVSWLWMAAVLAMAALGWFGGDQPRRVLEMAVIAVSPALTGFILHGRLRERWARGYLIFAWAAGAAMLAASTGGAASPALTAFAVPMLFARAIGGRRLMLFALAAVALGVLAAASLGAGIDPRPLALAGPSYAIAALALCAALLWGEGASAAHANIEASRHIAEAAHELRTPLNHMVGFAEMIERQVFGPNDPHYQEYAGIIRESGARLVDQITRRLDLTRIAAGRYDLEPENMDAAAIVREVVRLSQISASAKQIALVAALPNEPLTLRADPGAVRQILTNLVGNAIKFTPNGGRVRVGAQIAGHWLTFDVSDTGPGVPQAERDRLLEPFARGEDVSKVQGAGLGLALTKALAHLHGGDVRLNDAEGGGLRVRVRLPVSGP